MVELKAITQEGEEADAKSEALLDALDEVRYCSLLAQTVVILTELQAVNAFEALPTDEIVGWTLSSIETGPPNT